MIGGPTTLLRPVDRVVTWLRNVAPERGTVIPAAISALPVAISCVPDGMAGSLLAGVSSFHGLYANFAGPIAGGFTASTRRMVVSTTSAAALATGSALAAVAPADRENAVILITLLAGAFMLVAALLRLGRYTRFVSHSVMTGFLTGVALNIIFGQIPNLAGAPSTGNFALEKAFNVITHPGLVDLPSLLTGLAAIALCVLLARSRIATFSALIALALPTALVVLAGADSVARVSDTGAIPSGLPLPHLPSLSGLSLTVIVGALSVSAIVLVQGAGVADSAPNLDGSRSRINSDFIAEGLGNLASGFFRGQPVGGSMGQTSLNVSAGATSRWSAIFCGLWILLILVFLGGLVGLVASPTLAAVLIVAGIGAIRPERILTVLRTGATSQIAFVTTLLSTQFLPVAAAVGIGVALSLLLQLNRDALDLRVVELVPQPDGHVLEQAAPRRLRDRTITILDVYGSLYYAGARTLQARLPEISDAVSPVVILRMRGRTSLGATSLTVLSTYAQRLQAAGGRLYLTGLDPTLVDQFERTGIADAAGGLQLFPATPVVGESSRLAEQDARAWLATKRPTESKA